MKTSTIIDVARDCGYSKATVSRAFASPEVVTPKARERIYASAQKLHYAPDAIARAMARKRTENIAFIIHEKQYPAILNPFYSPILETVLEEANRRNYSLLISAQQDMRLPDGKLLVRKQMDGVILAGEADPQLIEQLMSLNIPVVLLNNQPENENIPCVVADHFYGAALATQHLIDTGHRHIGLLAGRFSKQISKARLEGYLNALHQNGIEATPQWMIHLEPTIGKAEQAMRSLIALPERPTAVFCTNDTIAAGALKALLRAGMRVPEQMALVGFDDSYVSRLVEPELTTLRIDPVKMGKAAVDILFQLMDGKAPEHPLVTVTPELIKRQSTQETA